MTVRVLLVEDDLRDAELTQARVLMSLPDCTFTVVAEESAFREELASGRFDVIIADYNLPSFSGSEALEIARVVCPQVPLILISGALGEERAIELLQRGAADFVGKQRLDKLPLVVHRVLQQAEERRSRVDAERARHEAEAYYRLLIEALKDYVVIGVDAGGRIHSCNSAALPILGCSAESLVGRPVESLFTSEEDGQPVSPGLDLAAATGSHVDERWALTPAGKRIFASVVTTAIQAQDGGLIGYSKIVRDRSEARLTAEALRESAERLRAALEAADAGTFRWSLDADLLVCDASLLGLIALPADGRTLGLRELLERVHPEDRVATERAWARCREQGGDLNREFRVLHPGAAPRWLHARGKTFAQDGRPAYMTGAFVDVTERKQAESALEEANRRKSEFLAILAHELRNPLAPIRSSIDALRLTQNPAVQASLRDTMERQVKHMVRLIDDLMDISRIDHGRIQLELRRFDLRAAVRSALEACTPLIASRGHAASTRLPEEALWVDADETRIVQVVCNLLNNAAAYTEPGGRIELTLERQGTDALIRVRDNGIGIAPELQDSIFESFTRLQRADGHPGGLGIGLAICARLVRMHGGSIEVKSPGPGEGSEFRVRLPARAAPVPAALPAAAAGAGALPALRILIVDDNEDAAESLAVMLRCLGHSAQALTRSDEVVGAVARMGPDVVLMDIGMPGMDGYTVCRQLRAGPGPERLPLLVAVTGWGEESDRCRSREAGFDLHLTKPVAVAELQTVFERVQRPLRPLMSTDAPKGHGACSAPVNRRL